MTPVVGVFLGSQREYSDFMSLSMQVLDCGIIGVLVRDEEGTLDLTTVGVGALAIEDFFVQIDIVDVDGTIEGDGDHLRYIGWF